MTLMGFLFGQDDARSSDVIAPVGVHWDSDVMAYIEDGDVESPVTD